MHVGAHEDAQPEARAALADAARRVRQVAVGDGEALAAGLVVRAAHTQQKVKGERALRRREEGFVTQNDETDLLSICTVPDGTRQFEQPVLEPRVAVQHQGRAVELAAEVRAAAIVPVRVPAVEGRVRAVIVSVGRFAAATHVICATGASAGAPALHRTWPCGLNLTDTPIASAAEPRPAGRSTRTDSEHLRAEHVRGRVARAADSNLVQCPCTRARRREATDHARRECRTGHLLRPEGAPKRWERAWSLRLRGDRGHEVASVHEDACASAHRATRGHRIVDHWRRVHEYRGRTEGILLPVERELHRHEPGRQHFRSRAAHLVVTHKRGGGARVIVAQAAHRRWRQIGAAWGRQEAVGLAAPRRLRRVLHIRTIDERAAPCKPLRMRKAAHIVRTA